MATKPKTKQKTTTKKVESKLKKYGKAVGVWAMNNGPGLVVGFFLGAVFL